MTIIADNRIAQSRLSLSYAQRYLDAGYCPIPVRPRSKQPIHKDWVNIQLSPDQLPTEFWAGTNVGVVLGEPSCDIIDIDLDDANALKLAPHFLPETNFVFGRNSKPSSHYIYKVDKPGKAKRWVSPAKDRAMIVELRANGTHTVFPGSIHESGEPIEFNDPCDDLPTPAIVDRETLEIATTNIAIGSVLLDHWQPSIRHELSLHVAGFFAQCGWNEESTIQLINAVAMSAEDDEVADRLLAVQTTYQNNRAGSPITGKQALVRVIGRETVAAIERWLGVPTALRGVPGTAANSNCQFIKFDTELDAATTFAAQTDGNLRYSPELGQWYRRDVQVFEPIASAVAQGMVCDFVQMADRQVGPQARTLKSRSKINAILELTRHQVMVKSDIIDHDKNLVGLNDGKVINLSTGNAVPVTEDIFLTKRLGATLDANAECPQWVNFLNQIFDGNQEQVAFVKRAVGYSLSGHVSEQCLFVLIGTGANGKSTFINVLRRVFGDYAGMTPMQTLTVMPFSNGQTNDLAAMEGKRFISASDGEAGDRLAEAKIKNMTGGDKIACRALYKDYREFDPQCKLWVATNELPEVSGSDDAIWRRIRVIKFPVTFREDQRDPNLTQTLADEASGILNWALEGFQEWVFDGLRPPAEVIEATSSYRKDNDLIGQFIDARCVKHSSEKCPIKTLYGEYVSWSEENGHTPMPLNSFGKDLTRKGYEVKKGPSANSRAGINLKPEFRAELSAEVFPISERMKTRQG
jgi:putative DNA primase/helicase